LGRFGFIAVVAENFHRLNHLIDHWVNGQSVINHPWLLAVGIEEVHEITIGSNHVGIATGFFLDNLSCRYVFIHIAQDFLDLGRIIRAKVFLSQTAAVEERARGCLVRVCLDDTIIGADFINEWVDF